MTDGFNLGNISFPQDDFKFGVGAAATSTAASLKGTADNVENARLMSKLKLSFSATDGMFKAEGPNELLQGIMQKAQQFDAIQRNYQKLLSENQQQLANLKANPWQNTLAHMAASFGANDPNPYTRSMSQAAVRLNPTEEELKRNQMAILQQAGQMTGREMTGDIAALRTVLTSHQREAELTAREAKTRSETYGRRLGLAQQMIKASGGQMDTETLKGMGLEEGDLKSLEGFAAGERKEEAKRQENKLALVREQDKTKVDIQSMKDKTSKALQEARTKSPEVRQKLLISTLEQITKMETRLDEQEAKISINIFATPEEKIEAVKKYAGARRDLTAVRQLAEELKKQAGVPSAEKTGQDEAAAAKAAKLGQDVTIGGEVYTKVGSNNFRKKIK